MTTEHALFFSVTTPHVGMAGGASDIIGTITVRSPSGGDYRLGFGSVASDAALSYGLSTDFEGQARLMGDNFGIGFDEALPARVFMSMIQKQ